MLPIPFYRVFAPGLLAFAVGITAGSGSAAQPSRSMLEVSVGKQILQGRLLASDAETMVLQRRDGSMNFIPLNQVQAARDAKAAFAPLGFDELREKLAAEFGGNYTVSRTTHFLVVHPPGDFQTWATPFEDLFRRFGHYFSSRGFDIPRPEFPLVAVVLNTRGEFDRFLSQHQTPDPNILGYYAPRSNRIITYRQDQGSGTAGGSLAGLSTIIHEAAHQSAFNTGIHSRSAVTPRWISEGLAVMFESRGVNNSAWYGSRDERVHRLQLQHLRQLAARPGQHSSVADLIARDDPFQHDTDYAYALAWGLTFYLAETRPREYFSYLRKTARAESFGVLDARQRLEDFAAVFGPDTADLEKRMWQFLEKL